MEEMITVTVKIPKKLADGITKFKIQTGIEKNRIHANAVKEYLDKYLLEEKCQ